MDFTLARGCLMKFKISDFERKNLITQETALSRRAWLRLRTWEWQDGSTRISEDLKPAGKEPCKPEKRWSLVWLKKRNSLAVTTRSWRRDVDAPRFASKPSSSPLKEVCTAEGSVEKYWSPCMYRCGYLICVVFKLDGNGDFTCKGSLLCS